ncbi:hypothetical protein CYMTET_44750 [Cymbomonas tetramitiformis]|uniref:SAP domain-containing protein n=1 Tax=Cymbomonas tetramitiformis TaxID=36881 RepID=A0AAE0C0U1_9CHLO|nr:hypothetical protein CYMTET_44750 [Cymbomonas tetramitiformis]
MIEASLKSYVQAFRLKELKDCLGRLSLSRQGRKQDLVLRMLSIFQEAHVAGSSKLRPSAINPTHAARIVEDVYFEMMGTPRQALASGACAPLPSHAASASAASAQHGAADASGAVRCICGDNRDLGTMVMCEVSRTLRVPGVRRNALSSASRRFPVNFVQGRVKQAHQNNRRRTLVGDPQG